MLRETNKPTVGQAFASRWLAKHYAEYKDDPGFQRMQTGLPQPEDLFQEISGAVDTFVEKKLEGFCARLRAFVVEVADGKTDGTVEVSFNAAELLKDPGLKGVAIRLKRSMDSIQEFPV